MKTPWLSSIALVLVTASLAAQAPDAACLARARVAADSLAKSHLTSTVLTQYQLRNRRVLDSLHTARCVTARVDTVVVHDTLPPSGRDTLPARIAVGFDYTTRVSWPDGQVGSLPSPAPSVLCATVEVGGVPHLGDRAVVATIVAQDSLTYHLLTVASDDTLRTVCGRSLPGFPAASAPLWPVTWASARVRGVDHDVAVPVATAVRP